MYTANKRKPKCVWFLIFMLDKMTSKVPESKKNWGKEGRLGVEKGKVEGTE